MANSKENKVLIGLENFHWFPLTLGEGENGEVTVNYGAGSAAPGTVNFTMNPEGDGEPFYADNGIYFMPGDNVGYSGDWEQALIPEDLKEYALGTTTDDAGVVVETSQGPKKAFAITGDLTGDAKARRVVFYMCYLSRPTVGGSTKAGSSTPNTETVTITAVPRPDYVKVKRDGELVDEHLVKAYTKAATNAEAYATWHDAPYTPAYTK